MAAGILMVVVGIAVLSRLFRHNLAGKVAELNLSGAAAGTASAAAAAIGGGIVGGTAGAAAAQRTTLGPPARIGSGVVYPLAARGTLGGGPGEGTHNGAPPYNNWQSSNAVDITVPIGTAVYAPVAGTVTRVSGSWSGGAARTDGYGVTIRGADGNEYFLKHLSRASIAQGDRVAAGQVIGASGAGNGAPHLHLAQRAGNPLDTFGLR